MLVHLSQFPVYAAFPMPTRSYTGHLRCVWCAELWRGAPESRPGSAGPRASEDSAKRPGSAARTRRRRLCRAPGWTGAHGFPSTPRIRHRGRLRGTGCSSPHLHGCGLRQAKRVRPKAAPCVQGRCAAWLCVQAAPQRRRRATMGRLVHISMRSPGLCTGGSGGTVDRGQVGQGSGAWPRNAPAAAPAPPQPAIADAAPRPPPRELPGRPRSGRRKAMSDSETCKGTTPEGGARPVLQSEQKQSIFRANIRYIEPAMVYNQSISPSFSEQK